MPPTSTPVASSSGRSGGQAAGSASTITCPPPASRNPAAWSRDGEVGGRVVGGRRPDVRLPRVEGEHRDGLVEPVVERCGLGGPPDADHPVPERIGVARVVEHERVAQVAHDPARDGVGHRLVPLEPAGRRVVQLDGSGHGPRIIVAPSDARQAKPPRCAGAYRRHETPAARPPPRARANRRRIHDIDDSDLGVLVATAALALAACSSTGATAAPASQPAASAPAAPASAPASAAAGGGCTRGIGFRHRRRDQGLHLPDGTQRRRRQRDLVDERRQREPHGDLRRRLVQHAGQRRRDGHGDLRHARNVRLPLHDPPEHDGVARGQVARRPVGASAASAGRQARWATIALAPDGRSINDASGTPAPANQPSASRPGHEPRALDQLVQLHARDQLGMTRAELVRVGGQVPVERHEPAPGPDARPRRMRSPPPGRRAGGARTGSRRGSPDRRGRRGRGRPAGS